MADTTFFDPAALAALSVKWIHFASVFALFGSALLRLWLPDSFARAGRATDALLRGAAVTAMMSGLGCLWVLLAGMVGGFGAALDPETLSAFFQSPFGSVAALRLILLAVTGAGAAWPTRGRSWRLTLFVVSALLLVDQAYLGHAAIGGAGVLVAYWIHVLAAAAWVGGLPPLLLALREAGGRISDVLERFSAMAMVAVALILATGVFSASSHALVEEDRITFGNRPRAPRKLSRDVVVRDGGGADILLRKRGNWRKTSTQKTNCQS